MKMTVLDFAKKADCGGDDIPIEVRDVGEKLIAAGKSLYQYAAQGGLELECPLRSVTIRRDVIVLHIK